MMSLDTPLLHLSPMDALTLRDGHIFVTGGSGAGKSSSSMASIIRAMLMNGMGGIAACVKANEASVWRDHARFANVEERLVTFSPKLDPLHGCLWKFNPLTYLMEREGMGAGLVEGIVELMQTITSLVDGHSNITSTESFWDRAMHEMIRAAVTVLHLSGETLSFDSFYALMTSAPRTVEEASDKFWQDQSLLWAMLQRAKINAETAHHQHNVKVAERYWLESYPSLADRTRSSLHITFSSIVSLFLQDVLHELLSGETTIRPEDTWEKGAIILLDAPIRTYGKVGRVLQALFKVIWQNAVLQRDVQTHPGHIFFVADEAQQVVTSFDFEWLAEARESKAVALWATQNISNFTAILRHNHDSVDALLGLFDVKIFHANSHLRTNLFASDTIGKAEQTKRSWHIDHDGDVSFSGHEHSDYFVPPWEFSRLKKAGSPHWYAEAIIFSNGRLWNTTGTTVLRVIFPQQIGSRVLMKPETTTEVAVVEPSFDEQIMQFFISIFAFIEELLILRNNPALATVVAEAEPEVTQKYSYTKQTDIPVVTIHHP